MGRGGGDNFARRLAAYGRIPGGAAVIKRMPMINSGSTTLERIRLPPRLFVEETSSFDGHWPVSDRGRRSEREQITVRVTYRWTTGSTA